MKKDNLKVLNFLKNSQWKNLTLKEIWKNVWLNHSQKVLNKITQLKNKWFITIIWKKYLVHEICPSCNSKILTDNDEISIFEKWVTEWIRQSAETLKNKI